MKFTLSWLKNHLETDKSLEEICDLLTAIGLEIEKVDDPSAELKNFVVGHVVKATQHPNADRLRVCRVDAGDGELIQVVCGAPNARTGMKGIFMRPGEKIPYSGDSLKAGVIRGEASNGMLCSERELKLGDDHDGIIDLPPETETGLPAAVALGLNDPLIEIELTPNRGDCAGVRGIARDLAAAGAGELKPLRSGPVSAHSVDGSYVSPIKVHLDTAKEDAAACPFFIGRHFKGVQNTQSPDWLKRRLTAIGLKPISALVDITNYMAFDHGRPLHVFDAEKLSGNIHVRFGHTGEELHALDGKTYKIDETMTVIADDFHPHGLGGIMGGEISGCTEETTNVFLEVAFFDPTRTTRSGQKLGLTSDARYRFERGVDPNFMREATELATRLILEICGGTCSEIVVAGAPPPARPPILWNPKMLKTFGGLDLPEDEQAAILYKLGFEIADLKNGTWDVTPPSWRRQFDGAPDIVEDILRTIGYDKVPAVSLPPVDVSRAATALQKRDARARRILAARGLQECITWSFVSEDDAYRFNGKFDICHKALTIENPIAEDLCVMRGSIVSNLAHAAIRNARAGRPNAALFEVGPIYHGPKPEDQSLSVAIVRTGEFCTRQWNRSARPVDAYDIKADLAALASHFGFQINAFQIDDMEPNQAYHPGRSAIFRLGSTTIARFGELHPTAIQAMGGTAIMVAGELNLDALPMPRNKGTTRPNWQPSSLQSVHRDFAFIVDQDTKSIDISRAIVGAGKDIITDVRLFDLYEGDKLSDGKKSLAYTVTLQPKTQAFTDEELQAISARVVANVTKRTGAVLRR